MVFRFLRWRFGPFLWKSCPASQIIRNSRSIAGATRRLKDRQLSARCGGTTETESPSASRDTQGRHGGTGSLPETGGSASWRRVKVSIRPQNSTAHFTTQSKGRPLLVPSSVRPNFLAQSSVALCAAPRRLWPSLSSRPKISWRERGTLPVLLPPWQHLLVKGARDSFAFTAQGQVDDGVDDPVLGLALRFGTPVPVFSWASCCGLRVPSCPRLHHSNLSPRTASGQNRNPDRRESVPGSGLSRKKLAPSPAIGTGRAKGVCGGGGRGPTVPGPAPPAQDGEAREKRHGGMNPWRRRRTPRPDFSYENRSLVGSTKKRRGGQMSVRVLVPVQVKQR